MNPKVGRPLTPPQVARAVLGLAALYGLRLLGIYLVLPVLSLYAGELRGASPLLIGMSIGVYGLTQAVLQVPFGLWSDRYGRRRVIAVGLLVFALGSVIAAQATTAWVLVIGRALQGAGAIASAVVAFIADITEPSSRTRAMGAIGVSIGLAFGAGLIFGPTVAGSMGVPFLFWLTAGLSVAGAIYVGLFLPRPPTGVRHHEEVEWSEGQLGLIVKHPALLRLDLSTFLLHCLVTALFVVGPHVLESHVPVQQHGRIYAPMMAVALVVLLLSAAFVDRKGRLKEAVVAGAVFLLCSMGALLFGERSLGWIVASVALAIVGVALAEPAMPALLTRVTPREWRGTAAGAFHTCQFMGSFTGGVLGGIMLSTPTHINVALIAAACLWIFLALGLPGFHRKPRPRPGPVGS